MNNHDIALTRFTHPTTRMLLNSDGSTTVLLEALLNSELHVDVLSEQYLPANKLPDTLVEALQLTPQEHVVARHSQLLTSDLHRVSENYVTYTQPNTQNQLTLSSIIPIGKLLIGKQLKLHRQRLAFGITQWPADRQSSETLTLCVYKQYVIHCDSGVKLHVVEHFNPTYISPQYK